LRENRISNGKDQLCLAELFLKSVGEQNCLVRLGRNFANLQVNFFAGKKFTSFEK